MYEHTINLVDGKRLNVATEEPRLGFFVQDDVLWLAAGDTESIVIPKELIPEPWVAIAGCILARADFVKSTITYAHAKDIASVLLANGREKKTRKRRKKDE